MVVHKFNKDDVIDQGMFLYRTYGLERFMVTPATIPAFCNGVNLDYELNNNEINLILNDLIELKNTTNIQVDTLETIPRCILDETLLNNKVFIRPCSAGRSTVSINPLGEVRACTHAPFSSGNILSASFKDIWDNLKNYRTNKYVPQECKECAEFSYCHGGCRFYDLNEGNSKDKKDPRRTKPLLSTSKSFIPYHSDIFIKYQNCDYFKARLENNNIYSLFNGNLKNLILVNEEYLKLVKIIRKEDFFCFQEFTSQFNLNMDNINKLKTIVSILIERGFLKSIAANA